MVNMTMTRPRLTVGTPLSLTTCPRTRGCDEYYLDKAEADCRKSTGFHHSHQGQRPRCKGCDEYYLDKSEADCRQSTGLSRTRGCDEYYLDKAEADCRQSTGHYDLSQDQRL